MPPRLTTSILSRGPATHTQLRPGPPIPGSPLTSASIHRCPSCSARVQGSGAATTCAFCASSLVADDTSLASCAWVIPFSVTAQQASRRLRHRLTSSWFTPGVLRTAVRPESLRAVLVPHWVYSGEIRSAWRGRVGITYSRPGSKYASTQWFDHSLSHLHVLTDHLVCASRGLTEAQSNELEPYDLALARPHDPALLAGLEVELGDMEPTRAREVALDEIDRRLHSWIRRDTTRLFKLQEQSRESDIQLDDPASVLLPVWLAVYRGPEGPVQLLVNGQTGEVAGRVPPSSHRVWLAVGALVLASLALSALGLGASLLALLGQILLAGGFQLLQVMIAGGAG